MTSIETTRRHRSADRERLVEQTGLDREALAVVYDEYGNRRRFEVLGGRLVEQPIMERSSHKLERETLRELLKGQQPRNTVLSPCAVRLPDGGLATGQHQDVADDGQHRHGGGRGQRGHEDTGTGRRHGPWRGWCAACGNAA